MKHARKAQSPAHPLARKSPEPRRQNHARMVRALATKLRPSRDDSGGADRLAANNCSIFGAAKVHQVRLPRR
jgi:hypothetical protein